MPKGLNPQPVGVRKRGRRDSSSRRGFPCGTPGDAPLGMPPRSSRVARVRPGLGSNSWQSAKKISAVANLPTRPDSIGATGPRATKQPGKFEGNSSLTATKTSQWPSPGIGGGSFSGSEISRELHPPRALERLDLNRCPWCSEARDPAAPTTSPSHGATTSSASVLALSLRRAGGPVGARASAATPSCTRPVRRSGSSLHDLPTARGARPCYIIPSASRAASDIMLGSHGGSQTNSSFVDRTPGTPRTLDSTSDGNVPAAGQAGVVSVI